MIWAILLIAVFSSLVSSTVGFGGAMFFIPLISLFIPLKNAIAISTIFYLSDCLVKVIIYRKLIDWKVTRLMLIGGIPFLVLGAFLMVSAPEILLRRLLGILVLIYVLNSIFKFTSKIKLSGFWIAAVSTLYGFFSGIIGTGGVVKAAVLHHIGLRKQKFVGTFAASALIFLIIKAIIFSKFSLISLTDVPLLIPLLIIGAIGPFIGRYLLRKFSSEFFRKLVIGALFVLSINLLFF